MALVKTGYRLTVKLADAGGNTSTPRYDLTATTAADAATDGAAIVTALDLLTDAAIAGYTVSEVWEDSASQYAAAGVQIENVALVTARIDATEEKFATFKFPAPIAGLFLGTQGSNANRVDPANASLVAFLNQAVGAGALFTVSDGEKLLSPGTAGNVDGKRIHRGSRRG